MQKLTLKEILLKYESGNCNEEEKAIVETFYLRLQTGEEDPLTDEDLITALNRIGNRLPIIGSGQYVEHNDVFISDEFLQKNKYRALIPFRILTGIAASLILAIGIFFIFRPQSTTLIATQSNIYTSPVGKKKAINLIDGTVVLLNSGSRLTILPGYNSNIRGVYLEGEAYFKVVHNSHAPFTVHTNKVDINDLGTVFNVKAYTSDKTTEAVLINGSIEVVVKDHSMNKFLLSPSKKVVIINNPVLSDVVTKVGAAKKQSPSVKVSNVTDHVFKNSIVEIDWTRNKLSFYDQQFDDIIPMIERWYAVTLVVENKQIKSSRFTGTFNKETIIQVLEALKLTINFNYRKEGNVITIY